jgi:hypothetical protein
MAMCVVALRMEGECFATPARPILGYETKQPQEYQAGQEDQETGNHFLIVSITRENNDFSTHSVVMKECEKV